MQRALAATLAAAAALLVATLSGPSAARAASDAPVRYVAPVAAPVVDGFRAPPTPYAAGNRGLEYATTPGTAVRAAADGAVVFAGPVAGDLHVTVLHRDGIRTSYSFLATVTVARGDVLAQGDVVGVAGARLFFGARVGDEYVDPALLLGAGPLTVHLVPLEPGHVDPAAERRTLALLEPGHRAVTADGLAWLRRAGEAVAGPAARGGERARAGWRAVAHQVSALDPLRHVGAVVAAVERWRAAAAVCTPPGRAPPRPAGRRIAVLVGGLGSSSDDAAVDRVDTAALGYAPSDVVRFSYAGGRVPGTGEAFRGIASAPYTPADSQADLGSSGAALAGLLREVAAAAPGVPVDVIAHSQGGLVARLALGHLAGGGLPATVLTLGSPHGGADLATAVAATGTSAGGRSLLAWMARALRLDLRADSPSVAGMAETSAVIADLARRPPPTGVVAVSVAARGDLVVPALRSLLPGAPLAIVPVDGPTAHDALPATAPVTRELALAVAGLAPTCEPLADAVRDALSAEMVSWSQDALGLAVAVGGMAVHAPVPR